MSQDSISSRLAAGQVLEVVGTLEKVYGNNNYLVIVELEDRKMELQCHMSGRMLRHRIRILPGDQVTMDVPHPYDKGRITFRGVKQARPEGGAQKRNKERKRPKGRGARR